MSGSEPDRYGVMGYPVAHSRSPVIHQQFALQTGQNMVYDLLEVPPSQLEVALLRFGRSGGKGLNITVPHKSEMVRLVDDMSPRARGAGAVNTVAFGPDGMFGDNTDGVGLIRDLCRNLGLNLAGSNILILGAGGATRGIVQPLLESRPESVMIANRTFAKAAALAEHFSTDGPVMACRFLHVGTLPVYDLVINATSAGLSGEMPPYPEKAVHPMTVCYDLSYGTSPTPFCRWAAAHGAARAVMGWGMLIEQAAESFSLWRGVRPDTAPVLKQIAFGTA